MALQLLYSKKYDVHVNNLIYTSQLYYQINTIGTSHMSEVLNCSHNEAIPDQLYSTTCCLRPIWLLGNLPDNMAGSALHGQSLLCKTKTTQHPMIIATLAPDYQSTVPLGHLART